MERTYRKLLPGLVLVLATWPGVTWATHFAVVPGERTGVVFESRAPMEKFKGRTDQVRGWLDADLDDLTHPVRLEIQVDLASFDTGMGKRNKHMRENHFETDRYPVAVFSGGEVTEPTSDALTVGGKASLKLTGTLDLHGVKHEMTCVVNLTRPETGTVLVEAEFIVWLQDHRIKRPKFLVMKLAEDQQVTVHILLREAS